jgi:hypothetical protein
LVPCTPKLPSSRSVGTTTSEIISPSFKRTELPRPTRCPLTNVPFSELSNTFTLRLHVPLACSGGSASMLQCTWEIKRSSGNARWDALPVNKNELHINDDT